MPSINPGQLPDKLRFCVLDAEKGHPLRGVPVRVVLGVNSANEGDFEIPLGLLASDHAGYLAFDLKDKKKQGSLFDTVTSIRAEVPVEPPVKVDLSQQILRVDLPSKPQAGRNRPELIPLSLPGSVANSRATGRGLNSVESPDVGDWLVSPGSFGIDAVPIIGEDGCEVLLPSHSAERIIRFHQLVRTPSSTEFPIIRFDPELFYGEERPEPENGWPRSLYYRMGKLFHYELVWLPLNHGLGQVLYSLTLAPCEAVRIAVIDWSRSEEAGRTDQVHLSDALTHSLRRDRSIEEVVNAVLREHQSGESFMGGTAGVGGYGGGFGGGGMGMPSMPSGGGSPGGTSGGTGGESAPTTAAAGGQQAGQNWGVTGSHAVGYAMANSSGNRDVDVETSQNLVDEISQASHLVRDLRSTVIVQANQAERETVQTRIVRNHNHSHALTILYYEVVRHYIVRSLRRRVQSAIFIKYPTLMFDEALAYKHRHLLIGRLRVPHLAGHFDALVESMTSTSNDLEYFNNGVVSEFSVTVTVSEDDIANLERLYLQIMSAGRATTVDLRFPGGTMRPFTTRTFSLVNSDPLLRYRDIVQLGLFYSVEGDGEFRERSSIQGLDVKAIVVLEGVPKLFDLLTSTERYTFENTSTFWQTPNRKQDASTMSVRDAEQRRKIDELLAHLVEHRHHYSMLIWLHESPHERAARFEHYTFNGVPLIERIDNRPIGVVGDYVAFPLENQESGEAEILAERIVSLPTRGAFAEAKLSHCNASEVIDDTRFWDWQISPCPDEPTALMPISVGSRHAALDVTPSSLPASGVAITQPPEAPEPFGLREVMALLRTPDIFRDMSGMEQLGPLLQKLVEVAGEVEKARIGATTTLSTAARDPGDDRRAGILPPTSSATTRERLGTAQVARSQIRQAQSQGMISNEQASDLTYRTLDNVFAGGDSGRTNFSQEPGVRQLIHSAVASGRDVELRQGADFVQVGTSTGPGGTLGGSDMPAPNSPFWGPLPSSDRWYQAWLLLYNFDVNATDLKPEHQSALNRLIQILGMMEEYRIEEIQGRASETGSEGNNQLLSAGRSNAVVSYLIDEGLHATEIPPLLNLGSGSPISVVPGIPEDPVNRSVLILYHVLFPATRIATPDPPRLESGRTLSRDWAIRVVTSGNLHEVGGVSVMDVHIKNCVTGEARPFGMMGVGLGISAGGSIDLGGWTSFHTLYPVSFREFNAAVGFYYTFGIETFGFGAEQAYLRLPYLVDGPISLGGMGLETSFNFEGGGYIDLVELMAVGTGYIDDEPCP